MATRYQVRRGKQTELVEIAAGHGPEVEVAVAGQTYRVRLRELPDGRTAVSLDDAAPQLLRTYTERGEVVVVRGHEEFRFEVEDERNTWLRGGAGGKGNRGGQIKASMPGRVVRLPVQVGDLVPEGGVVAVLEAMKMENDVRAPGGGVVKQVAVQVGQAVEAGVLLVELEPAP